jgi:hypothetical protein
MTGGVEVQLREVISYVAPSTHWLGGWVGLTAGLDTVEKRKILSLPGIKPLPVAILTELSRLSYIHALWSLLIFVCGLCKEAIGMVTEK